MSRWNQQFEGHAFRANWDQLLAALDEARVDDLSAISSVEELGRLKKVISYVGGLLRSIDPELVPLATWEPFNQQAIACLSEIHAYNSNKNIGHIQSANVYADNLLTYVRPYMVVTGRVAKNLRDAAAAYSSAFVDFASAFKSRADELIQEIGAEKDQVLEDKKILVGIVRDLSARKKELIGDADGEGEIGLLNKKMEDFIEKEKQIEVLYQKLFVSTDENRSIEESIRLADKVSQEGAKQIRLLSQQSATAVESLSLFHEKIFGSKVDGEEVSGGLQAELEKGLTRLKEFEAQQKERYNALNEQIEGLLPGATSAGLASSCKAMRVSFDDTIRNANRIFYGAIAALVVLAIIFSLDFSAENIGLVKFNGWQDFVGGFFIKIPFFAAFIWLAYFASSRRSEFQRLQQEYAHKEVIANSYESYRRQVDSLGVEAGELARNLLEKAIQAIAFNASETLDKKHGDKMPAHTAIDKIVDIAETLSKKIPDA